MDREGNSLRGLVKIMEGTQAGSFQKNYPETVFLRSEIQTVRCSVFGILEHASISYIVLDYPFYYTEVSS